VALFFIQNFLSGSDSFLLEKQKKNIQISVFGNLKKKKEKKNFKIPRRKRTLAFLFIKTLSFIFKFFSKLMSKLST
jgi:hypothetical protein